MFKSRKKREKELFDYELESIKEEINRSYRFNYKFSVLAVEVSHSIPRGLSKIFPGNVVSFHIIRKHLRNYDKLIGPFFRRYFIILPQTGRTQAQAVIRRISELSLRYDWGNVFIGISVYPDDEKDALALFNASIKNISKHD